MLNQILTQMTYYNIKQNRLYLLFLVFTMLCNGIAYSQEATPNIGNNNSYHNQLYFNRFFINPTFSLVRENKSYLNILHRNQYTTFEDNRQNYYLGFSNKLNENTALGIGVYSQWAGVVQEFGFNANYATSIKLGAKSSLAFGTNLTYYNEGIDKNRVVLVDNDPQISEATKESKLAIQPGLNLTLGSFDFGLYATDLFKYNQTTNDFLTNISIDNIKASLQYTYLFNAQKGLFENARLMPLLQLGKNRINEFELVGSLLLDLPKHGWFQTSYDPRYGNSLGIGFMLSRKMSLGYLVEKDLKKKDADLGWNHEISMAYTFSNQNGSDDWVDNSQDAKIDQIVRNYEEQISQLTADKNISKDDEIYKNKLMINKLAYENRMILDQLILRQDSIEVARTASLERRFEMIIRAVRNDINTSIKSNLKDLKGSQKTMLVSNEKRPQETDQERFRDINELPIKILSSSNIVGVESGYYVIANVFKNKNNLNAFMRSLKAKGLNPKQFHNKENGLSYVYLADYNYKGDAKMAYASNLDGKYQDEKWIMEVANNSAIVHNSYND